MGPRPCRSIPCTSLYDIAALGNGSDEAALLLCDGHGGCRNEAYRYYRVGFEGVPDVMQQRSQVADASHGAAFRLDEAAAARRDGIKERPRHERHQQQEAAAAATTSNNKNH